MDVKIKAIHQHAKMPAYSTPGAACFDLFAAFLIGQEVAMEHGINICNGRSEIIPTGLAFEIPPGFVMMIYSRSGHGFNSNVRLANCVGVIDSDYRGELMVKLTSDYTSGLKVRNGDRIAQAMIVPVDRVGFAWVDQLEETARGENGFGSTGA